MSRLSIHDLEKVESEKLALREFWLYPLTIQALINSKGVKQDV
jgi:hypothetical protein